MRKTSQVLYLVALTYLFFSGAAYWYLPDETATTYQSVVSWLGGFGTWLACVTVFGCGIELGEKIKTLENNLEHMTTIANMNRRAALAAEESHIKPAEP